MLGKQLLKIILISFIGVILFTNLYGRELVWDFLGDTEKIEIIAYYVYHTKNRYDYKKLETPLPESVTEIKEFDLGNGYKVYQIPPDVNSLPVDVLDIGPHYFVVSAIGKSKKTLTAEEQAALEAGEDIKQFNIAEGPISNEAGIVIPETLVMNKLNIADPKGTTEFVGKSLLGDSGREIDINWELVIDAKKYEARFVHLQNGSIKNINDLVVIKTRDEETNITTMSSKVKVPGTGSWKVQIRAGRYIGTENEEWSDWFDTTNTDNMLDGPVHILGWPAKVGPLQIN